MENTTKAGTFHLTGRKIIRGAILVLCAFIIGHGPVLSGCFPAAVAFISYMVYRSAVNLYLVIPVVGGILPYLWKGMDPWGDMAAVLVCGVLFAMAGKIKMSTWQIGLIAASIGIVCVSICRLATATVYKISPEKLMFDGLLIFAAVFVFDTLYKMWAKDGFGGGGRPRELPLVSVISMFLMVMNGAGADFLIWPAVLFMTLAALTYLDAGAAFLTASAGGVWAALMGQGQWGMLATVIIGILAAGFVKRFGAIFLTVIFISTCWALGTVESGVVLGVDNYCLFLSGAFFAVVNWKAGGRLRGFISAFLAGDEAERQEPLREAEMTLRAKADEMEDLAELYGTYLDSRSALANQFDMMRQMMNDTRRNIGCGARSAESARHEKFGVDVAVSQCAAAGAINGDCCGWQDIGDGRLAMVLSDGMGKGKKAAAESLLVTKTLIALLKSGVTADLTLKMINTVMLMKDDEDSYATVDMAIVDKRIGKAKFYKIGAAPTLIRRKDAVEELKLSAVPLGIVNGLRIRYMETALKKGDWIIMMSDGVSDGGHSLNGRDGAFLNVLKETAAKVRSEDPGTMSDLLLNQAADSYIGRERDDLTVLAARII